MAKATRILAKMRRGPLDWRIEDFEVVASAYGCAIRRSGGSHVVFTHPGSLEAQSIPAHRPIKPVYVRHFVAWIDSLEEGHGTEEEQD